MKAEKRQKRQVDIGGQFAALGRSFAGFVNFVRSHGMMALIIAVILILIYRGQAFSNYYYIDKEAFVNVAGEYYNWDVTGRFGLILINKVLGQGWYNPYVSGILFLIGLWFCAMALGYLFYSVEPGLEPPVLFISMLLFMIYPTYVELFLFQFVAYEILIAMGLMLASDWLFVLAVREKNGAAFLVSLPFVVIAFGSYQSLVPLQLCLYLGIFLMLLYREEEKRVLFPSIGCSIFHFAAALGISEWISKCFFSGSSYVSNMVAWQSGNYEKCLQDIRRAVSQVVKLRDVCHPLTYDLCWGLGLIALAVLSVRCRRKALWYALGLLGVVFSPFFLLFVMGQSPVYRTQTTFPLAIAVLFAFSAHVILGQLKENRRKTVRILFALAGGIMLFLNVNPMMRLYYTRDVVGRADEMTATLIIDELNDIPAVVEGRKPVAFIGHKPAMINASCYTTQDCWTYTVMSAFELDYGIEPYYFFSTQRILGYFRTLGVENVFSVSEENIPRTYEDSRDMPIWPQQGSIREFDDYVIVKLGETELPPAVRQ